MGWLLLLLLLGGAGALLRWLNVEGAMLKAAAAALLLGAAGYVIQGRPGLPGTAAAARAEQPIVPLAKARHAFFGEFTAAESWMRMSEALASRGNSKDAVNILGAAVRQRPADPQLWVGLGNALVDHSRMMTPPAELAYRRAAELAPAHPAPAFFMGVALARSGEREAAVALWRQVLATAPPDATWRPLVEGGIAALSKPPPRP